MTPNTVAPRPPTRYAGLDGLRAIAVALVVVYHLFPQSWVRGGFIGVDVFFVISGFLITTLLLREHAATGRIGLGAFWLRRARRLLPALALVVTVCATAAWFVGGDVLVRIGEQVLGAATFSYNWVSIGEGNDYFSAATPELFRNFWSLAVEEQFYVIWPLVLPLFLLLPRAWARTAAALALAVASAGWMGVVVTSGGDLTRGYFGTDTHAFGILLGIAVAFALESVLAKARGASASPPSMSGPSMVPGRIAAPGIAAPAGIAAPSITPPPGWTIVLPPVAPTPPLQVPARVRVTTAVAGTAALAGIAVLAVLPPAPTLATFPGVVFGASILSAIAIVAAVWPGSAFGPAIDARPLRWIGDRSYGIYLWHWPLLVILVAAFMGTSPHAGVPLWIGGLTLALTLVAAELSYRLVETPVRRYGFRGSLTRFAERLTGSPASRVRAIAGVSVAVLLFGGTSGAIAVAPGVSSGQSAVAAGLAALEQAEGSDDGDGPDAAAQPSAEPTDAGPSDAEPSDAGSEDAGSDAATSDRGSSEGQESAESRGSDQNPVPTPSPTPVAGTEISAIGDSVMLASAPALLERFPGIQVDAAVSRSSWAGPGILQSLSGSGQLRPYVVVALGTNGPLDAGSMDEIAQLVGPDRHLVLVNAFAPRDWIAGVNSDLAAFAASHPGVVIADWSGAIAGRTDLLAGDQIHPGDAGGRVFADAIAAAVDRVEQARAATAYQAEMRTYRRLHRDEVRTAE
jgi:peptidoglycan/LPS O-acetylase OafA/YrhL